MTSARVAREEFSKIMVPLFRADLSLETALQGTLTRINMCKCGHFTVYQTFDLILVSLKSRTNSIVLRPPVHVLFLCFHMQTHHYVRCYLEVWANTANNNNRSVHLHHLFLRPSNAQMELGCDVIPTS